ncbi:chorismate mutase [Patescibacteria group bacterium]|nr:chorismate mutase [Patescibacteria group bacterium]MCL5091583.1 chorismate mutase [Patescibacteria group bacterium]
MKKLDVLRQEIDGIDEQMLQLLKQRLVVVKKIGIWKKQNNEPALDKQRWSQVLKSRLQLARRLKIDETLIKKMFGLIHEEALRIEK